MAKLVIFVTGSTEGGIGAAICEEYAARGAVVYAGVRKLEALGSLAKTSNIKPILIDVVKEESIVKAVDEIITREGQIDILVNNAGVNAGGGISTEVPLENYRKTFDVNFFGLINVSQKVAYHMAKRRSGSIVNIGSVAGYVNLPFSAAYSSSKAAVHSLSDVMRIELAPLGIHVLCVAPGKIKSLFGEAASSYISYPAKDSPFHGATKAIAARTNYSQEGKTTPSSELARAVRLALEKPAWRRRAYLTYGETSTLAWFISYLPPFLRDLALSRRFKLDSIAGRG
jgi:1-acylglycerone phosphate reductase